MSKIIETITSINIATFLPIAFFLRLHESTNNCGIFFILLLLNETTYECVQICAHLAFFGFGLYFSVLFDVNFLLSYGGTNLGLILFYAAYFGFGSIFHCIVEKIFSFFIYK